jgi:hypothetical protein
MSNMFDIAEVRKAPAVSLHVPLGCGLLLFAHGGNGHHRPETRVCQKWTAYCYRPPPPGCRRDGAIKMSLNFFESRFVRKSAPRRFASREPIMDLLLLLRDAGP